MAKPNFQHIAISTTNEIPGYKIKEYKGLVWASATKSKSFFSEVNSVIKLIFGMHIEEQESLTNSLKWKVLQKLNSTAEKMGANAIVGLRINLVPLPGGALEIYAYGTAVVI